MTVRPVVVLDRDGVINVESATDYVRSVEAFVPIAGSVEAIARLCRGGYAVYIATNQSGIGQGLYSETDLAAIHDRLRKLVAAVGGSIDGIRFCPHERNAGCACRKPAPGMLLDIAESAGVRADALTFVGDAVSDHEAAERAGCRFMLVLTGKGQGTQRTVDLKSDDIFADLSQVADHLLD